MNGIRRKTMAAVYSARAQERFEKPLRILQSEQKRAQGGESEATQHYSSVKPSTELQRHIIMKRSKAKQKPPWGSEISSAVPSQMDGNVGETMLPLTLSTNQVGSNADMDVISG
jgi:hypothetical protein